MVKAVLLDFDGTLVKENILAIVCEIVGKKSECLRIDRDFQRGLLPALSSLIDMINLLKGISVWQVEQKLQEIPEHEYLMPGTYKLLRFFRDNRIVSILASANILPILQYFQKKLQVDYVIGSRPKIENGIILGISEADYTHKDFKLYESKLILKSLGIKPSETLAIGDSPGDKSRFLYAGKSIAINPKEGIEQFADHVIGNDLSLVIPIIKSFNQS
jgi:phosphoserine phosphatase